MDENLSQSQADTLMQQLDRQVPVNRRDAQRMADVQPYQFRREEAGAQPSGGLVPFERLHQTMLADVRTLVFDITRQKPAVTLTPLGAQTFKQWREQWQEPCQLHHVKMEPLGVSLVLSLESSLVCGLVDLIFGGDGTPPKRLRRKTFSHSEAQIAGKFTDRLLQTFNAFWSDIMPVNFARQRMEVQPQFANFMTDGDLMCGFRFGLTLGTTTTGVNVLFPEAALQELQARFQPDAGGGANQGHEGWEHQIRRKLENAQVEMQAELASIQLTIEELLSLQRGDIIPISAPSALTMRVGDKPVFACGFGISQGRHAVRVEQRLAGLAEWMGQQDTTAADGAFHAPDTQTGEMR